MSEGTGVWKICVSVEQADGSKTQLEFQSTELLIGRTEPADILLDGPMVSRRHVWLRVNADGKTTVEDAGSTGGTLLNGAPLRGVQTFIEDDELKVGDFVIRLTEPPSQD